MSHATADGGDHGNKYVVDLANQTYDLRMIAKAIDALYATNATHVRRGYQIQDSTVPVLTTHLMEEVVEIVEAALVENDRDHIIEESGDALAILMHILRKFDISPQTVIRRCLTKMARYWTDDPAEVNAAEAGFGRRGRGDPPGTNRTFVILDGKITVTLFGDGSGGDIVSPLRDDRAKEWLDRDEDAGYAAYAAAMDSLESVILGHACAGIDIEAAAYQEGVQTAIDAIGNNL